jgi:3-methyladenine DNA glycosylase AlkD
MSNKLIQELRNVLIANSDKKTKNTAQRFFKEPVKVYGVKSALATKIGKEYFEKIEDKSKKNIFKLCEQLYQSGFCEEAWMAASWSHKVAPEFQPEDMAIFESWISNYVDDWAKCDTLCNHTVGELITMYPKHIETLKSWTKSSNRWLKRASAVSLIIPAKNGQFLKDIFQIANNLLLDKDDMVQKGYGWLLKEASRQHQQEVFDYVYSKKAIMPRTALRYAIEKMPQDLRKIAMEK